jgi:hypothetical protein
MKICSIPLAMRKCKLKHYWDFMVSGSEWLSSRKWTIANICENVGGKEPIYTVGGNII